jgi:CelD/BcsL family acetyltransferase involved in cellulose biosynthesis
MAATSFSVIYRGTFYYLVGSYCRGQLSSWGPGATLLRDLIAFAIERGCTMFDLALGDESYKYEWCDTHIALHDYRAAVTWRGIPETVAGRAFTTMKRTIKRNRRWRDFALGMRAKLLGRSAKADVPEKDGDAAD